MPIIALAGALAACSMLGVPLSLGFTAKELVYERASDLGGWALGTARWSRSWASALLGVAGLIAGVSPFAGAAGRSRGEARVPLALAIPALVLAAAGLLTGFGQR